MTEKLDRGVIDFAVLAEEPDAARCSAIRFPEPDVWGLVFPAEDPLAEKAEIRVEDLIGRPLFCSEQSWYRDIPRWCGGRMDELRLEGSFRLSYNGSIFAREGLGYLLTFDRLIDTSPGSGLVFRPLQPRLETEIWFVWKKYPVFTPLAERFLNQVRDAFTHPEEIEEPT